MNLKVTSKHVVVERLKPYRMTIYLRGIEWRRHRLSPIGWIGPHHGWDTVKYWHVFGFGILWLR